MPIIVCDHCLIENNICVDNTVFGIRDNGSTGPNNVYRYNLTYGNGVGNYGKDGGITADPLGTVTNKILTAPQFIAGTYRLSGTSPAKGTGIDTGAPIFDLEGNAYPSPHDLGCYSTNIDEILYPPLRSALRHLYVDGVNGNDGNDGSAAHPWKTITHAALIVRAGDVVHVLLDTYTAPLQLNASGTVTDPIIFVSEVRNAARIGISGSANCVTLQGDYIQFIGFEVTGGARGINSQGSRNSAIYNWVHDVGDNCINGQGTRNGVAYSAVGFDVVGNRCENSGPLSACIYLPCNRQRAIGNLVIGSTADGITCWHAANNLEIINNTVIGSVRSGINIGAGDAPSNGIDDGGGDDSGDGGGVGNARVTQLPTEVLIHGTPKSRVTQLATEVLSFGAPRLRVSQIGLEVIIPRPPAPAPVGSNAFIVQEKTPKDGAIYELKAVNYDDRYYAHDQDYKNGLFMWNGEFIPGSGGTVEPADMYYPTLYNDIGKYRPSPDNSGLTSTTGLVQGVYWWMGGLGVTLDGHVIWSGFPAIKLSADVILNVEAAIDGLGCLTCSLKLNNTEKYGTKDGAAGAIYQQVIPAGTLLSSVKVEALVNAGVAYDGMTETTIGYINVGNIWIQ